MFARLGLNQWTFKFFVKIFKFTYENLNWKFTFYQFSIPSSGPLSFYTALEKYTIFLEQNFRFQGELHLCGRPCFYLTFNSKWKLIVNYKIQHYF